MEANKWQQLWARIFLARGVMEGHHSIKKINAWPMQELFNSSVVHSVVPQTNINVKKIKKRNINHPPTHILPTADNKRKKGVIKIKHKQDENINTNEETHKQHTHTTNNKCTTIRRTRKKHRGSNNSNRGNTGPLKNSRHRTITAPEKGDIAKGIRKTNLKIIFKKLRKHTTTKLQTKERGGITPNKNNPSRKMEKNMSDEDQEELTNKVEKDRQTQKGQKRKSTIDSDEEVDNLIATPNKRKGAKAVRVEEDTSKRIHGMKLRRQLTKPQNIASEDSDSGQETTEKALKPQKEKRQCTIPGYVQEMKKGLRKQQERHKDKERDTVSLTEKKKGDHITEKRREASRIYPSEDSSSTSEKEDEIFEDDEETEKEYASFVQLKGLSTQEIPDALDRLEALGVTVIINSQYTNANGVTSWRAQDNTSRMNWLENKDKWKGPGEILVEQTPLRSNLLHKCSVWSYYEGRALEDPTMEEWNAFCDKEKLTHLKNRVTISYYDSRPPIGPRFILETPREEDAFELINNHQGGKLGRIPVRFGPYFDKYKPPISVSGGNLPPTWEPKRIIKLAEKAGIEILTVTTPPSMVGKTHYCFAQVRTKDQRDKLIKLSGTKKANNKNDNTPSQKGCAWMDTSSSGQRKNPKKRLTKKSREEGR